MMSANLKAKENGMQPNVVGPSDPQTTRFIYRMVVIALFIVGVGGLAGILFLVYAGKTVPEAVVALASTAIGAMAGLLAPSPATR
jgi:hypothetical protein